jgi:hypothetical protein
MLKSKYLKIIIWFLTDDSFELWIMQNIVNMRKVLWGKIRYSIDKF